MKVHLAVSVKNVAESVQEYSRMLGSPPDLVIGAEYALWRTDILNLSIRKTDSQPGTVRHIGLEVENAAKFEVITDGNGLEWEFFNKHHQAAEIKSAWPDVSYTPK